MAATDLRALKEPSRGMLENDLLQHNLAVFRHGEGALQVAYFMIHKNSVYINNLLKNSNI